MAGISVDTSEVRAAVADLTSVDSRLRPDVAGVVKKGAQNVKDDLQAEARKSRHFRGFAPGISYDMKGDFEAEIGPTKGRPGSLANIAYFGTSRGGGTVEEPAEALQREIPEFEKRLGDIAEKVVFG